jgi:hypothetical protein
MVTVGWFERRPLAGCPEGVALSARRAGMPAPDTARTAALHSETLLRVLP